MFIWLAVSTALPWSFRQTLFLPDGCCEEKVTEYVLPSFPFMQE
jgi:hypothetical protein